jgi:hypothetical protein
MAKHVRAVDADRIRRLGRWWSALAEGTEVRRARLTRAEMTSEVCTAGGRSHAVFDAALEAFADPDELEPSCEMRRAGAP